MPPAPPAPTLLPPLPPPDGEEVSADALEALAALRSLDGYGPPRAATAALGGRIALLPLSEATCFADHSHLAYFAQLEGAAGLVLINADEKLRTLQPRDTPFAMRTPAFNVMASEGARLWQLAAEVDDAPSAPATQGTLLLTLPQIGTLAAAVVDSAAGEIGDGGGAAAAGVVGGGGEGGTAEPAEEAAEVMGGEVMAEAAEVLLPGSGLLPPTDVSGSELASQAPLPPAPPPVGVRLDLGDTLGAAIGGGALLVLATALLGQRVFTRRRMRPVLLVDSETQTTAPAPAGLREQHHRQRGPIAAAAQAARVLGRAAPAPREVTTTGRLAENELAV